MRHWPKMIDLYHLYDQHSIRSTRSPIINSYYLHARLKSSYLYLHWIHTLLHQGIEYLKFTRSINYLHLHVSSPLSRTISLEKPASQVPDSPAIRRSVPEVIVLLSPSLQPWPSVVFSHFYIVETPDKNPCYFCTNECRRSAPWSRASPTSGILSNYR